MASRYTVTITGAALGGANPATVSFDDGVDPNPNPNVDAIAGRIIAYLTACLGGYGSQSQFVGITIKGLSDVAPPVLLPFPTAGYTTARAAFSTLMQTAMPAALAFGTNVGAATTLPRGTSWCVNEQCDPTSAAHPKRGRHFVPNIGGIGISTDGTIPSSFQAQVRNFYSGMFLRQISSDVPGAVGLPDVTDPVVARPGGGLVSPITGVKPSNLLSLLQSRKR